MKKLSTTKFSEAELLDAGYRKYRGKTMDVFFKREQCQHAGFCVRGSHEVFNVNRKPWILPDNTDTEELKAIVDACPSGALHYIVKSE